MRWSLKPILVKAFCDFCLWRKHLKGSPKINLKMTSQSDFWDSWGQKRWEPAFIIRTSVGWKRTALKPRAWVGRICWELPGQTTLADIICLLIFFPLETYFLSEAMFSTVPGGCGHFLTRIFLFRAAVVWHVWHWVFWSWTSLGSERAEGWWVNASLVHSAVSSGPQTMVKGFLQYLGGIK